MADETRGKLSPDAHKLNVLIRMLQSTEPADRNVAVRALRDTSPPELSRVLKDPGLSPETLDYFARHAGSRSDFIQSLRENPALPDAIRVALYAMEEGATEESPEDGGPVAEPGSEAAVDEAAPQEEVKELTVAQQIAKMGVGQKIKMAMKGDKEVRTILIKDSNREVYMSVLNNPGLKDNEIEMLVKSTGTSSDILRVIGKNREWTSNSVILRGLVMNPKTPVEISIRFLLRLSRKDLEQIDRTRNLPAALRANAKRLIAAKKKKG